VTLPVTTEAPPAADPRPRGGRRGQRGGGGGGFPRIHAGLDQTPLRLWQAVHEGKTPLFVNVANAAAIVHLLKAIEPYKDVKLVLNAPGPALQEALDHLAGRKVQVLIRPGLSLKPNTRDRIDVARLLHEAGVEFAF